MRKKNPDLPNLTENDRKVLKKILNIKKIPDSAIAKSMQLSPQAIFRIREKSYFSTGELSFWIARIFLRHHLKWGSQDVLKPEKLVTVFFWTASCPHCKAFKPIFEKVSAAYADKILFVTINVAEYHEIPEECFIVSVPTRKFF